MRRGSPQDLQIPKLLFRSGLINKDQYEGIIHRFEAYGGYIDEIILDLGAVDEKTLLSTVASYYKTKFVTLEKLKNAEFSEECLRSIPEKVAKQFLVFPISYNPYQQSLTIISSNPGNIEAITEIERASNVRKVKTYVARSEAIKLAIKRWYDKDPSAFGPAADPQQMHKFHQLLDVYEKTVLERGDNATSKVQAEGFDTRPFDKDPRKKGAPAAITEPSISIGGEDFLAALQVLVGFIERERGELKGHSVLVSRHALQLADRIRMPKAEAISCAVGALLHDMGKGGLFHLTQLNVSFYEGHRDSAMKRYLLPIKMFEHVSLPLPTRETIEFMYERYDGQGLPSGLQGKEIPAGARMVAIIDSFSDLVMNPRNPYRRVLSNDEALQIIEKQKGSLFDPVMIDAFKLLMAGDRLRTSLLGGQNLLVVESDPEQATILDISLASRGFNVEICDNSKTALEKLMEKKFDLIVAEVAVEPMDGFEMVKRIRANEDLKNIPVIFHTTRSAPEDLENGFALGAADYVVKPSSPDLLIAKIAKVVRDAVDRRPVPVSGVSGSLREMDLPDLIQVLSQGRKTGKLSISAPGAGGGEIHFLNGQIVNAIFGGKQGEEAFYAMLHITDGHFSMDPTFSPRKILINAGTEGLLLEGMRLLDESKR